MIEYSISFNNMLTQIFEVAERCVIKRENLAISKDVDNSYASYSISKNAFYKLDNVHDYEWDSDDFINLGLSAGEIEEIILNPGVMQNYLTKIQVEKLLNKKREERVDSYSETNKYYLSLSGQPSNKSEWIYLEEEISGVDTSKPVHEFNDIEIGIIKISGVLLVIQNKYKYDYLMYIDRKISPFISRDSSKFSLLYCSSEKSGSNLVNIFKDTYETNRRYFLSNLFDFFYDSFQEHYEDVMILYLLGATVINVITEISDSSTDLDLSEESMEKIFESKGVPNWNLPIDIKKDIARQLHYFIQIRGTKQVVLDIASIFNMKNVYRYILHKDLKESVFDENTPEEDKYDLNFYKVPYNDKDVYEHLKDPKKAESYDSFLANDNRWGSFDNNLKDIAYKTKYSSIETKYISIENMVDISKELVSFSLFFNMTFDNSSFLNMIHMYNERNQCECYIVESLCYLISLISIKYEYMDSIAKDAETITYVMGLNTKQDLTILDDAFHKVFQNTEFVNTLDGYSSLDMNISAVDFMDKYCINIDIVRKLKRALIESNSISQYNKANEAMSSISTMPIVSKVFEGHDTYSSFIEEKNVTLHTKYSYLKNKKDIAEIDIEINETISFIKNMLNTQSNEKILKELGFFDQIDSSAFEEMKRSLFKVLSYFKSYTVDIRSFNTIYIVDEKSYSNYKMIDMLTFLKEIKVIDNLREDKKTFFEDFSVNRKLEISNNIVKLEDVLVVERDGEISYF